jgi:hypothetical protein
MPTEYCRHIRANGTRCRSFALTGHNLCYWHHDISARHRRLDPANIVLPAHIPEHHRNIELLQSDPLMAQYYGLKEQLHGPMDIDFPALEDHESIQVAISMLVSALGKNRLDPKRAGSILYGLQVASSNVGKLTYNAKQVVRETVLDESGSELAPDEDPEEVTEHNQFMDELEAELAQRRIEDDEED